MKEAYPVLVNFRQQNCKDIFKEINHSEGSITGTMIAQNIGHSYGANPTIIHSRTHTHTHTHKYKNKDLKLVYLE